MISGTVLWESAVCFVPFSDLVIHRKDVKLLPITEKVITKIKVSFLTVFSLFIMIGKKMKVPVYFM